MERSLTTEPWTLETLAQLCARVLSDSGVGQQSGRVGALPSARDIRYYATLGVVDRPSSYQGRVALYGRRHLLQLVALKRLQATGLSLAEIQARLLGLPDRALEPLAQLPDPLPIPDRGVPPAAGAARGGARPTSRATGAGEALPAPDAELTATAVRSRDAFWKQAARGPLGATASPSIRPVGAGAAAPTPPASRALQEVVLAPGIRLQVEGFADLQPADLARLQTAAVPLIVLLRQLAAPDQEMP